MNGIKDKSVVIVPSPIVIDANNQDGILQSTEVGFKFKKYERKYLRQLKYLQRSSSSSSHQSSTSTSSTISNSTMSSKHSDSSYDMPTVDPSSLQYSAMSFMNTFYAQCSHTYGNNKRICLISNSASNHTSMAPQSDKLSDLNCTHGDENSSQIEVGISNELTSSDNYFDVHTSHFLNYIAVYFGMKSKKNSYIKKKLKEMNGIGIRVSSDHLHQIVPLNSKNYRVIRLWLSINSHCSTANVDSNIMQYEGNTIIGRSHSNRVKSKANGRIQAAEMYPNLSFMVNSELYTHSISSIILPRETSGEDKVSKSNLKPGHYADYLINRSRYIQGDIHPDTPIDRLIHIVRKVKWNIKQRLTRFQLFLASKSSVSNEYVETSYEHLLYQQLKDELHYTFDMKHYDSIQGNVIDKSICSVHSPSVKGCTNNSKCSNPSFRDACLKPYNEWKDVENYSSDVSNSTIPGPGNSNTEKDDYSIHSSTVHGSYSGSRKYSKYSVYSSDLSVKSTESTVDTEKSLHHVIYSYSDPFLLDDPNLRVRGRHTTVVRPGYRFSFIPYGRKNQIEYYINQRFWIKHSYLEPLGLKLTHIRHIKKLMMNIGMAKPKCFDCCTAIFAICYFEELVLRSRVNFENRNLIAAGCLVLALKFLESGLSNQIILKEKLKYLFNKIHEYWGLLQTEVFNVEFEIYSFLNFSLWIPSDFILTHYIRQLEHYNITLNEYLQKK